MTTGSNVRSFSYLPTGQVQDDTRDPSHAYVYTYNQTGRLTSATLNGTTAGSYLVNGMEQRVAKTVGSTTTHFIFDRLGHLLAEANGATGATQKEYIWLDDLPVAMVDDTGPSPVITYIHTDHLGTPQKITDSSMNLVWDGVFDPFGNVSSITGSVTMNLRFPGQYFDAETGIAQNWNRDYDPTLGRYIESDPIGIGAGTNTYAYVRSNPNGDIDPIGLQLGGNCPPSNVEPFPHKPLSCDRALALCKQAGKPSWRCVQAWSQCKQGKGNVTFPSGHIGNNSVQFSTPPKATPPSPRPIPPLLPVIPPAATPELGAALEEILEAIGIAIL